MATTIGVVMKVVKIAMRTKIVNISSLSTCFANKMSYMETKKFHMLKSALNLIYF
jgi:hypothetical protein